MEPIVLKHKKAVEMTDDEFAQFCAENRDLRIERNSNKNILIMSPTHSYTGKHNSEIIRQLSNWNHKHKSGYVFDSSTGFTLSNNAMRCPDAAWLKKERWDALSEKEKKSFAPLCPDFLIELKSDTDSLPELKNKMQEWLAQGCRLGWLIDIDAQKIYIYKPGTEVKTMSGFDGKLSGEEVLNGFELDLTELKL
ncbi:MAG: Uma2 family endonuclease [Bacteroidetes bacterium]|nr:Uma2 family endonuclease [Bacteroidota bacterium]